MAVKCDAFIVYHNGQYLVRPAFAIVAPGGKFRIRNMADVGDAEVTLPVRRLKDPLKSRQSAKATRPEDIAEFELDEQDGSFSYQVTINGQRAAGESDPVIIIDPPAN
jgi:hypothetical protein